MIHWFPGHMAKQFKLLKEKYKIFDLFIIVLDSRIPISSFNNDIYQIANNKPILFVFNKSDKADTNKLQEFLEDYKKRGKVLVTNLKSNNAYGKINSKLNEFYLELKKKNELKGKLTPSLKCIVLGVPNVGKSTFINLMAKTKSAKVGANAGITRSEQWINCRNYLLLDTPGLLMPKLNNNETGAKLALVGSIRYEALNQNELIVELYRLVSKYYPEKLESLSLLATADETEILNNITKLAQIKNFLAKNNGFNLDKAIKFLINYFKDLDHVIFDKKENNA
ncbi:ribosome biogenesis GTPase YlqF [[Mycoplasma] phocae]|uniref:Ribosome biogenesis GTPase A n=1 Tax=[Mycoplasma] phocae TaxID=142651 RepID=A0A2Z5IQF4_9BACT|nr:ribosome biogenesis GTPase YlqF [[Mycoplasma] phocae]AXE60704.1 ribosome biogenesis GTPase YlqF [[Mycoplasma] phocae]